MDSETPNEKREKEREGDMDRMKNEERDFDFLGDQGMSGFDFALKRFL
jgi:hypothetical protein